MRPSSARKRAAIIDAARGLFLREGYERTSMDGIAAAARVSKPTVYGHFGDKKGLFSAIVGTSVDALVRTIDLAATEELAADRPLAPSLLAFVRRVIGDAVSSSDYTVIRVLLGSEYPAAGLERQSEAASQAMFTRHFAALADAGRIVTRNPARTAQHFVALTLLLATEHSSDEDMDQVLQDGVDAFVRAYGR
ncbi:TetR/AcrR family transcriptional regulator [Streptomyces sp. CWNU-52B]|uniref:TetR/AcrR family transcriptional regulator n=1 Tax=unclassified Streptomyces TaxID=2593676 RepID=UPI0039C1ADE2